MDRVDGDKGYSPDNCRWADQATQSANRKIMKGETHYKARLTTEQVREIRKLLEQGKGLTEIGRLFDVTNYTIYHISKRRSWRSVTG